jgi:hypothetical protein
MKHTEEEFKTQLKFFEVVRVPLDVVPAEDSKLKEGLMVWCPQKECGQWFIVPFRWRTLAYGKFKTHTCPYCFKTARVPKLPPRET